MNFSIRIAEKNDAASLLRIYSPFIANTAITFEYDIPSIEDFAERIRNYLCNYPWIVCECDKELIAYAYALKHRDRKAYQWSAEVSVYADEKFHGKGIAAALYETLFSLLKLQGILNLYAGITQPNIKSVSFHRKQGFTDAGFYKNIGYKLGSWHDVLWMYHPLAVHSSHPDEPLFFEQLIGTEGVKEIILKANRRLLNQHGTNY